MKSLLCFLILSLFLAGCGHRQVTTDPFVLRQTPVIEHPELIVVDAGHGGKDAGTCNSKESYEEKAFTLETARFICQHLKQLGYKTVLTRHDDTFVPLETRAEIANTLGADLFVSIHYNHSSSAEAKGIEVYYYKEKKTVPSSRIVESKLLSSKVLSNMITTTGAPSRGVKEANFAVVRETKMPAVLVEAGFLSNAEELAKIRESRYQHQIAKGIALGVDAYLQEH